MSLSIAIVPMLNLLLAHSNYLINHSLLIYFSNYLKTYINVNESIDIT